jgi:tRNA(Ile)-lysidine synthase
MARPRRLRNLEGRILERARRHLPDGPCVVALSGGADSAVCAWAMAASGRDVRAVFVHHGFPESDALQRSATDIAAQLGLPFEVVYVAVPDGPSPEAQARRVRYQALRMKLGDDARLVTGHTADDQAETVLANLIRGAGLRGLVGIPVRRDRIVRPLLEVWRRETRELATLLGLPWRDDPTNRNLRVPRNALRLYLIPEIEQTYNPAFRESLVRLASLAAQDDEFLERRAARVPIETSGSLVRIPAGVLAAVESPIAQRVVRRALRVIHPPYPGNEADVAAVLRVVRQGGAAQITGAVEVRREGPWVTLSVGRERAELEAVPWAFPGEVRFGPWHLRAWYETAPPTAFSLSAWTAVFDADRVPAKAEVRTVQTRDTIPMITGRKSVFQALAEADLPDRLRREWPIVVAGGETLWVPGVRSSQLHWVAPLTRRYLWVEAEREDTWATF